MDLGFIIEASWVEMEGCLTINYKHSESGYKNEFYDRNNPESFKIMKSLDNLGASFEVNITQRVQKLRLFWENGYLEGLKGFF